MANQDMFHAAGQTDFVPDTYHIEKLKRQHKTLETRLTELSRRSVLTPAEEEEIREIKHQKLVIKDLLSQPVGPMGKET
jgi:hypothetical protein